MYINLLWLAISPPNQKGMCWYVLVIVFPFIQVPMDFRSNTEDKLLKSSSGNTNCQWFLVHIFTVTSKNGNGEMESENSGWFWAQQRGTAQCTEQRALVLRVISWAAGRSQGFNSCLSAETTSPWLALSWRQPPPPPHQLVLFTPPPRKPPTPTLPTVALIDTYTIQLVQRQGSHRSHRKVIDWNTHFIQHLG